MVSIVWWGYAIQGGSVDVEDSDLMSVIDDVQWVLRSMLESNTSRLVDDNKVAPSPVVSKGNRKRRSTSEAGGEGVAPKKKRFNLVVVVGSQPQSTIEVADTTRPLSPP
ncbi:hypothetical protein JAAARDRAFT_197935 [Jaapia argillacea MUCL 33604]|uniref:Uncharacterized protein n=1 Tax=Jaapia argillacea MUCL 33604 TaxID=933084 RepID=A0A067PD78_9AGAM|nr:hypothetical protein JAAARDRAFT_197935 [Jaapia argillacea MUCL 33604]